MVGGRAVGVIVTASVVGLLADKASWNAVFWLLAGLTLIPLPLVLAAREAPRPQVRQFEWKAFGAFKKVSVIALAGLGLLFFLIIAGANQLVNPYLTERFQISLSTAGLVTTVWGLGVITGSLAGGYIMRRVGDKVITWITMAIGVVALGFLAFVPSLPLMWVAAALFGLCYGTYQTVYFALAMKNTDQRIAASMFAILMAVSNIGQAIGMGLGGALAENSSYQMAFLVLAAVNILVIPLMPLIFRKSSSSIPVA
jgi:predicted MFS family arabinose efflux permease